MQETDKIYIKRVAEQMDVQAPDMTEIRFLANMHRGSMVHCTLQPGQTSRAGIHQTIEEMWYALQGQGDVWLKRDNEQREEAITSGNWFTIPVGTQFQVRNTGSDPLCFIIVTMPPWPGEQEWRRVTDHWPLSE
jgi:mannose-6-phosphate isomerase-like protein (cupin superfamily)